MKRSIKLLLPVIAAACLAGCAKTPTSDYGELSRMEFDAWISVNKQAGWEETPCGAWIIEKTDDPTRTPLGSVEEYPHMHISYTVSKLDGTVNSTTDALVAQRVGSYQKSNYYGPQMNYRGASGIYAGVEEALSGLHEGCSCKVVVPGWLLTHDRFSTKQKYLDNMTSKVTPLIYEVTVNELIADTEAWEIDFLKTAIGTEKVDTLDDGVYYICDKQPDDDTDYDSGDKVYINYVCRRMLDGQGVDTNMADSAKVFGIYKSSSTYSPSVINWSDKSSGLTMTSSENSVVSGFSTAIFNMHSHEKGRVYMVSSKAYSTSGSGDAIPGYCPLMFEIAIVDNPS